MKKVLLISRYFAPMNKIAAIRLTKIGKYLAKKGYEVDVITVDDTHYIKDDLLLDDIKYFNSIIRLKDFSTFLNIRRKILNINKRNFNNNNQKKATQNSTPKTKNNAAQKLGFFILFSKIIDDYLIVQNFKKKKIDTSEYDYMISSYGTFCNHIIAKIIKNSNPNIKWIADFRDPVYRDSKKYYLKNFFKNYEKKNCKKADAIVAVSKGTMDALNLSYFDKPRFIIENGFDFNDIEGIIGEKYSKLTFCYTGQFYKGKSDISALFLVLLNLVDKQIIDKKKLQFIYAGNDFNQLYDMAKKYELSDILINKGFVNRSESLSIQKSSDILVLASWNTKVQQGVLTGKFFEYMLCNKPIIALITGDLPNSTLKQLIKKHNLGFTYESINHKTDLKLLEKYILNLYNEFSYNNCISHMDNESIKKYDYTNISEKIIDIFECI